jgi:hypothetical protein
MEGVHLPPQEKRALLAPVMHQLKHVLHNPPVLHHLVLPVIGQTRAVLPIAVMGVVQLLTQNRVIAPVMHQLNHVLHNPPVLLHLVLPVIGQTRAVLAIAVMGVVQLLTQNRVIALVLRQLKHVLHNPPVVVPMIGWRPVLPLVVLRRLQFLTQKKQAALA